tara:strand:+ start:5503 stop:5970 length:468 start_codon:yes stop_codon:yes gene_type:complete
MTYKINQILLGAGCFWHVEKVFNFTKGVSNTEVGYAGGNTTSPTYEDVCSGSTNHAEVVKIDFNPEIISFAELLEIFWNIHDPSQLNRQGLDIGTQYRSCIFTDCPEYITIAKDQIALINSKKIYNSAITTQIYSKMNYYPAEDYHQKYMFRDNF